MEDEKIVKAVNDRWPGEDNRLRIAGALAGDVNALGERRAKLLAQAAEATRKLEGAILLNNKYASFRQLARAAHVDEKTVRKIKGRNVKGW